MSTTLEHEVDTDVDPNIEAIKRAEALLERAKFAFNQERITAAEGLVEDAVDCLRGIGGVA